MENRDRTPRLVWLSLAVIVAMLGLGLVPQFELWGMHFERIDMLSALRASDSEVVEYEADIERLEQELAAMHMPDTLEVVDSLPDTPPVRYEWIVASEDRREQRQLRSEDVRAIAERSSVAIEDFDTLATTRFDSFVDKLASGERVRIAFMGDSFVEGDILTSDLREELQSVFGGRGVGFVACDIPFATVRRTVKRVSSGWSAYSVMKPKSAPQDISDKFFVSGYLAKGGVGASTRWMTTDAFEHLDSCTRASVLLYSRDTSRVTMTLNDTIVNEIEVAGYDHMREIYVEAENIASLGVRVSEGDVICYGVSLEGDEGVTVDNFSVRSNNGHAIFGTGAAVNREIDEILGYDLVVLQYGLNIMQKGQRGYSSYRKQLMNMIAYAERCFPNAAILVLGVSDRWVKNSETSKYEPIGSVDALTSYQRAAADSTNVTFWNTAKAMASLGGMPAFVSNGWAAKDYTHINFVGGRHIARLLASALAEPVYHILVAREAEAEAEAERVAREQQQRERMAQEARERLERRLDAVKPLVESVHWNSEE